MYALFRLVELSGGRILINSQDISTIGLDTLRSRISIITQDPVLFSGTLRANLDPFNDFDDAWLWQCIDRAGLKPFVSELEGKLDATVGESGENYSTGQRQLLCLARALLRKSSIIVLDEATGSVDVATDSLVQQTIRGLTECTVLTIAHRLNTIVDYDRILVMDKGQLAEFDTPEALKNRPNGFFANMLRAYHEEAATAATAGAVL